MKKQIKLSNVITYIFCFTILISCKKTNTSLNSSSDVKITHTKDNTDIYTFWKNGFQFTKVYEIDANGKYVEDTTSISYSISPEIPRPNKEVEFVVKLNNPNLKIIKAFIGTRFQGIIDTINKPTADIFFRNNQFQTKKLGQLGDNVFFINVLAQYKGVIKYYNIIVRYYVLPENEIEKYKDKELSDYYYPLTYMELEQNN